MGSGQVTVYVLRGIATMMVNIAVWMNGAMLGPEWEGEPPGEPPWKSGRIRVSGSAGASLDREERKRWEVVGDNRCRHPSTGERSC